MPVLNADSLELPEVGKLNGVCEQADTNVSHQQSSAPAWLRSGPRALLHR